jgi:hypothetical protein
MRVIFERRPGYVSHLQLTRYTIAGHDLRTASFINAITFTIDNCFKLCIARYYPYIPRYYPYIPGTVYTNISKVRPRLDSKDIHRKHVLF